MKVLFDTSALVPALTRSAANHAIALEWLEKAQKKEISGFMNAHALTELYLVLTGACKQKLHDVEAVLDAEVLPYLHLVALGEQGYVEVIRGAILRGLPGGIIYDCIHVHAARLISADVIVTGNQKHFDRICSGAPPEIVSLTE